MRIAIAGAGAIGSVLAGFLAENADLQLSLLARGAHHDAIRRSGLTLLTNGVEKNHRLPVSDDPGDLGPQDVIILTAKAHQIAGIATKIAPMLTAATIVLSVQNGLPWWYFYGSPCGTPPGPFDVVDPGGIIWKAIPPERVLGGVISVGADIVEPGVARHRGSPPDLAIGAPEPGAHAAELKKLAAQIQRTGIKTSIAENIRTPLWRKLQVAAAFGPTGVLTGASLGALQYSPGMKTVLSNIMSECSKVAAAAGIDLPDDVERRLSEPMGPPEHRPSMLQDFEAGKEIELDATLTAVIEMAARFGVRVPTLETILALTRTRIS